jgi:hypothetical protein
MDSIFNCICAKLQVFSLNAISMVHHFDAHALDSTLETQLILYSMAYCSFTCSFLKECWKPNRAVKSRLKSFTMRIIAAWIIFHIGGLLAKLFKTEWKRSEAHLSVTSGDYSVII